MNKPLSISDLLSMSPMELEEVLTKKNVVAPGDYIMAGDVFNRNQSTYCIVFYKVVLRDGFRVVVYNGESNDSNRLSLTFPMPEASPLDRDLYERIKAEYSFAVFRGSLGGKYKLSNLKTYITKILGRLYSPEKFSCELQDNHVVAMIHFPEIVIKNSAGLEHIIRDLYVRITFNAEGLMSSPKIARTTFISKECISDAFYIHSHLSHSAAGKWSASFCYGPTIIYELLQDLQQGKIEKLSRFLIQFEDVLAWESLEGGPHKQLATHTTLYSSGITSQPRPRIPGQLKSSIIEHLLLKISSGEYENILEASSKGTLQFKEKWLHTELDEALLSSDYGKNFLYEFDPINKISGTSNSTDPEFLLSIDGKPSRVIFREEVVPIHIEDLGEDGEDKLLLRAHIETVWEFSKHLSEILNYFLISNKLNNEKTTEESEREGSDIRSYQTTN